MEDDGLGGFDAWYTAVHPRLLTTVVAMTGDADLGRDATDEALARTYERWRRVSRMESPAGWTYRVACNVVRRRLRRRAIEQRLLRAQPPRATVAGPAGELWLLVAELPRRQATAMLLHHVAQLMEPEIATVMGIKRGTVSVTLRNAYERLRAAVEVDDSAEVHDDVS
jgi:RNA polymerase sigma-70 factor (ECF subfamily)